ncbi:MAG: S8 family serine peptidase [Candidatus Sericytochromatia bacterium]|nr:S8 family serine peptidase [Candidatus Sericytochromatia bacterium]
MNRFIALTLLGLVGCGSLPAARTPLAASGSRVQATSVREVVVAWAPGALAVQGRKAMGVAPVRRVARLGLEVYAAADPAAFAARARHLPGAAWAEPNGRAGLGLPRQDEPPSVRPPSFSLRAADDPMLGEQWALGKCRFPEAWTLARGGSRRSVAVVDTGADIRHEDLKDKVVSGWDFVNQDPDPKDDHFHGTHCAGIVGAATGNGVGVAGGAPDTPVLVVKALDWEGMGTYDQIAQGIVHAVDRGAKVVSLSLGAPQKNFTLSQAIKWAVGEGVLVVAAMGNEDSDEPSYPAAYPGVLAVGSTRADDTRSGFSNRGSHISVTAPGSKILSTDRYDKYQVLSGTSMATPLVAALASMVWNLRPEWTAAEVAEHIRKTSVDLGEPGFDTAFGAGRIDALAAVQALVR